MPHTIWVHILIAFQSTIYHKHLSRQKIDKLHRLATKILSGYTRTRMVSNSRLSYLMKIAGAAVAACMVSHSYAGHLCLKEKQMSSQSQATR